MIYLCSMIFRYIMWLVLAYFVFRLLGRIFDPLLSSRVNRTVKKEKKKEKVGEYIDYEEVEK